jgi:zinc protease
VSIAIASAGGVNQETVATAGLTGLVARTSIKGTRRRNAAQLAMEAEALGSAISPTAAADLFDWFISVPKRHFHAALELLADAALAPSFPADQLEREKQVALADLQRLRDDMYRYPIRLFQQAAYGDHAYGLPLEASEAAVAAATTSSVRDWHAHTLTCAASHVFIVGDVDPEEAAHEATSLIRFGPGENRAAPTPRWQGGHEIIQRRAKAQTALVLGFPAVGRNDPDVTALQLLSNAVAGLGGRLFEELRSKRSLAYTVAAYPMARQLGGAFIGYIGTSPEREDEARSALLVEFQRMREERLPEAELERAKRFTIGTWQIRAQTNAAQLSDLMNALLIGDGLREIREYEARVRAVTTEKIREVAERYLNPDQLTQAVVRGTGASR